MRFVAVLDLLSMLISAARTRLLRQLKVTADDRSVLYFSLFPSASHTPPRPRLCWRTCWVISVAPALPYFRRHGFGERVGGPDEKLAPLGRMFAAEGFLDVSTRLCLRSKPVPKPSPRTVFCWADKSTSAAVPVVEAKGVVS